MRTLLILLFCFILSYKTVAQYTAIPDVEFEYFLINTGIDSEGTVDGQVLTSDVESVTVLSIPWAYYLTDLTGIEDFTSLEDLMLLAVGVTEIDLSQNINLKEISFNDVALNSLNLDNNINLQELYISVNCNSCYFTSNLSSLDLSNNVLLEHINVSRTLIEEIDLSQNVNIDFVELGLENEQLRHVNLKNGNNINCHWVQITAPNLICTQVDDPEAVIEGLPPYESWNIPNGLITDDCTGVGVDEQVLGAFKLYPNPISDILYIESDTHYNTRSVTIYDMFGKLIQVKKPSFNTII